MMLTPLINYHLRSIKKIEPRGKMAPKGKKTRDYMANGRYNAQEGIQIVTYSVKL